MAHRVCPPILGYVLLNPLRKLIENPERMFSPHVLPGMTVLEPGCGMGYFTLPLARLVGPEGHVITVDIQPKMLAVLEKRARKAGLSERIEARLVEPGSQGLNDLKDSVDFAAAIHMVHEMPEQASFFCEIFSALKPGGRMLVKEPGGHVSLADFEKTLEIAGKAGFSMEPGFSDVSKRRLLLIKS